MTITTEQRLCIGEALDALWREVALFHGDGAAMHDPRIVTLSRMVGRHRIDVDDLTPNGGRGDFAPVCSCGHSFDRTYRTRTGAMNAARRHAGLPTMKRPAPQLALPHDEGTTPCTTSK